MVLLSIYLLVAIGVSFLCSLLEAVLLSVPQSHVAVLVERGAKTGQRLQQMKSDIDQPLAAILTLNTFAHTLGAAGVGAEAARQWGDAWVGVVSFVVTLLILIFSEIIPKTIGAVHSKGLAPIATWIIHYMIIILRPVVVVCNWISLLISHRQQSMPRLSREEIRSIAKMALDEGAIDETEAVMLTNLIALRDVTVEHIMTPRTVVYTLRADQTVGEVMHSQPPRFSRIPIVNSSLDQAQGVIHRREIFTAMAEGKADVTLGDLARPLHIVPEVARLPAVLKGFVERREHLFLVVDEYGSSVGIVTLEDIIESLLGVEIIDETDAVEDMQQLAKQALSRLRHERHDPV
ncbi:MAG: hemolysin family protein [Planctomycetota bacterium]